jgi:hypothetical protein
MSFRSVFIAVVQRVSFKRRQVAMEHRDGFDRADRQRST